MEENRDVEVVTQRISCLICEHEVPLSEAVVPEAADYLMQFCSLDCYAAWLKRAADVYPLTR